MVQTRSELNGLNYHSTIKEAFEAASNDPTIWKISFNYRIERVRLVRHVDNSFRYESIMEFLERGE